MDHHNNMGHSVHELRCRILLGRNNRNRETFRRVFRMCAGAFALGIAVGLAVYKMLGG